MKKAILIDSVSAVFGSRKILDQISFSVGEGTIHGLLGPNGAGKTTTMKLLAQMANCQEGSIQIFGQEICNDKFESKTENELKSKVNEKIGFLLDQVPLYGELTVEEYLTYLSRIRRIPKEASKDRIEYCLDVLDLQDMRKRSIENLSKGYKQRVGIAQAIIHDPALVILDEPTLGLDPQSMLEIRNLILKLKKDHTILVSSHLLHEMSLVCDEVTIISDGRILVSAPLEDLQEKLSQSVEILLSIKTVDHPTELISFLNNSDEVMDVKSEKESEYIYQLCIQTLETSEFRPILIRKAVELDLDVLLLTHKKSTLEDIFMDLTRQHD